jgi:hypothetical protein
MSGVTWQAIIRLDNGDQVPVQVRATTQYDAKQLIELQLWGAYPLRTKPGRFDPIGLRPTRRRGRPVSRSIGQASR